MEVPNKDVGLLIPTMCLSCIIMRSVPNTTEPVVIGCPLTVIILIDSIILSGSRSSLNNLTILLVVANSIILVSISSRIESTRSISRHNGVTTLIDEVIVTLELILGHTLTIVQLSKNTSLNLIPCETHLVTTVHVVVAQFELDIDVVKRILGLSDTKFDITVTDNLTILSNEVNTYQRLTVDNLTASLNVINSLTSVHVN